MNIHEMPSQETTVNEPKTVDMESHALKTSSTFHLNNPDFKIERYQFMASSWSRFKGHCIYQLKVELELLKNWRNWVYVVLGLMIIYLHVIAHNIAYYLAEPAPPLKDQFHELIPALDIESSLFQLNTVMLLVMFGFFTILGLSILFVKYPTALNVTAVGFLNRYFLVINIAQLMRISTFLITQIPAPNPMCQPPYFNPPKNWKELLTSSAGSGDKGCGDLIFSSHVLFGIMNVLIFFKYVGLRKCEKLDTMYNEKGLGELEDCNNSKLSMSSTNTNEKRSKLPKTIILVSKGEYYFRTIIIVLMVLFFIADIILILAARKHYSVDIVLSIYITYMLWHIMKKKYRDPEIPQHLVK